MRSMYSRQEPCKKFEVPKALELAVLEWAERSMPIDTNLDEALMFLIHRGLAAKQAGQFGLVPNIRKFRKV